MFPRTSRYANIEIAKYTGPDQREIPYLLRRFVPAMPDAVIFAEHRVEEGDRLDNVTAKYLGDPEQFWRVCDANGAMRPDELTEEIARWLKMPLPSEG